MTLEECSCVMSGEAGRDLLETRDMRNLEDLFRRCCGRSGVAACCWSEGVAMMLPDMLMLVYWREVSYTSQCMLLIGLARVVFNKRSGCSGTCVARVGNNASIAVAMGDACGMANAPLCCTGSMPAHPAL